MSTKSTTKVPIVRMAIHSSLRLAAFVSLACTASAAFAQLSAPLPNDVHVVWDLAKAYRESTPTQERICLNALWRWQPARALDEETTPASKWGFFKVPGSWPGISDYMQKDSQTLFAHPDWKNESFGGITAAWYEREILIPSDWAGRRISVSCEYLNSFAAVYVDGRKAGELRFPAGDLDVTALCAPGKTHRLTLRLVAMPLKGVLLSYTDSASAREVKGAVARRGLCGDVFLIGTKTQARLSDLKITTSTRQGTILFDAALLELAPNVPYRIRARVIEHDAHPIEWTSASFTSAALVEGRIRFEQKWNPKKRWDIHTPQIQSEAILSLLDDRGTILDTSAPARFGFRELWIDGRDFYLNGSRIFLSAVPLDNAEVGAAWASYEAARESFRRLQSFGINFVYTHNYGCEPGTHLSFSEILRAADDSGMLVSLSQPHFSHYDWKSPEADRKNGYADHANFYTHVAQNHPSVVFYSMSHNATGYSEDMNPDMIDGKSDPRDQWAANNVRLALRAESIVHQLDPSRIVYHHASGNLSSMHAINFYPNFVPIQELSDWFGHWAKEGVKPVFLCEYGAPFTWDWTMYRGWHRGQREFGSAKVPWEFCVAEWNAQFFGDRAYRISEPERANLRWEAKQFRAGNLWHRWDYPTQVGSSRFDECYPVFARYLTENWRAFRTWGVSANSPWEYGHFWKLRDGVNKQRQRLNVDWDNLQRPGFSADYIDQRFERMDLAFEREDWIPTVAAQALIRNNGPVLAYLAGKESSFTSKDHNFLPGQTIEKQAILINNSRETVSCAGTWSCRLPEAVSGSFEVQALTGEQKRVPLRIALPRSIAAGKYELTMTVRFSNGPTQTDTLAFEVLPPPTFAPLKARIALFDPKGETETWLREKNIRFEPVPPEADLTPFDFLIVGKAALTLTSPAPDISRVRDGLKVVLFEQTSAVLEKRFGFRVEEYGLRSVFKRVPDHPLVAGLNSEQLENWRGEATLVSPKLKYEMRPRYGPTVSWCDIPVTRLWRCGNRGNVASVLIEKPARGDFLPILDGGYALQFSPLMEYREGKGLLLLCQMDVTGRTATDPAAETLLRNLLEYVEKWKPEPKRGALYVGETAGRDFFQAAGIDVESYEGGKVSPDHILIAGPQSGPILAKHKTEIADWLRGGGNLFAIGLTQEDANSFLPFQLTTKMSEHISSYFETPGMSSLLRGIGPADVHNRDPRDLPLISAGSEVIGDGVLAFSENPRVIFCQLVPWQFDQAKQMNLKRTFRHASFLVARLLANLGASSSTPLLERFHAPVDSSQKERRWLTGFYLDQPEEWDDPYRFFRW